MASLEQKHPFGVRLFWVAVLVAIAAIILLIYFERNIATANHRIDKNGQANSRTNHNIQVDDYNRCLKSVVARNITIHNAKAERVFNAYLVTLVSGGLKASLIIAADPHALPDAKKAAQERVDSDRRILSKIPNIIVPDPIKPCVNPFPKVAPQNQGSVAPGA